MTATRLLRSSVLAAALLACPAVWGQAAPAASPEATPATKPADDFETSIDRRATETVVEMKLDDAAKAERVKEAFKQHMRNIQTWHDAHGARRKELEKAVAKTPDDAAIKSEFEKLDGEMREIHKTFMAAMEKELSPEQLAMVKERLVGGRMAHNKAGYTSEYPDLPESERQVVFKMIEDAGDQAAPLGTAGEKSAVFEKLKGKINNYLSKKGYHDRTWAEKQRKKAAASQPATGAAK